jgi:hypothetical protein
MNHRADAEEKTENKKNQMIAELNDILCNNQDIPESVLNELEVFEVDMTSISLQHIQNQVYSARIIAQINNAR